MIVITIPGYECLDLYFVDLEVPKLNKNSRVILNSSWNFEQT